MSVPPSLGPLIQPKDLVPSKPFPFPFPRFLIPYSGQIPRWLYFIFCAAFFAFNAFFLLLLIMTMLRKLPTTAPPRSRRITGIRIAHTRGGKRDWTGWESSTKG